MSWIVLGGFLLSLFCVVFSKACSSLLVIIGVTWFVEIGVFSMFTMLSFILGLGCESYRMRRYLSN